MPIQMERADLEFLQAVQDGGQRGLTQQEIADSLGVSLSGLRNRVSRLGFALTGLTDVRTTLRGERLVDLLERGDIAASGNVASASR